MRLVGQLNPRLLPASGSRPSSVRSVMQCWKLDMVLRECQSRVARAYLISPRPWGCGVPAREAPGFPQDSTRLAGQTWLTSMGFFGRQPFGWRQTLGVAAQTFTGGKMTRSTVSLGIAATVTAAVVRNSTPYSDQESGQRQPQLPACSNRPWACASTAGALHSSLDAPARKRTSRPACAQLSPAALNPQHTPPLRSFDPSSFSHVLLQLHEFSP